MRFNFLLSIVSVAACGVVAQADLLDHFADYDVVEEIGVSGLVSTYHADTKNGSAVDGDITGDALAILGPARVSYPKGIGEVPSPGGSVGQGFDQGVLGIATWGDEISVSLATRINPLSGRYNNDWKTWYGQGDLFIDVHDSTGVEHFALLNTWARNDGSLQSINRGHFSDAMDYHVSGGANGGSLEGHLVKLNSNDDVAQTGGRGAYDSDDAPAGLDMRLFAEGGEDQGSANLVHAGLNVNGVEWYVQTWTIDAGLLSSDDDFTVGLHSTVSCGNDQIGGTFAVPEPSGIIPMIVAGVLFLRRR